MNDIVQISSLRHHAKVIEHLEKGLRDRGERIGRFKTEAMIDPLTSLWNRRYAQQAFHQLHIMHPGYCIAMLDIDHFKKVNDQHGHDTGDEVLVMVAELLKDVFRSSDIVIRWGGEEFMVLLHGATINQARVAMEKFRTMVERAVCRVQGVEIRITVTIGIAEYEPALGLQETIRRSDECLYRGNRDGRNCVVCYVGNHFQSGLQSEST